MSMKNPFHVVCFTLLGTFVLWLGHAYLAGFFITSVPQDQHYCKKWVPLPEDADGAERLAGSSVRCVEFVNRLERLKYYHNLRMVERNRILLYVVMVAGFLLSIIVFYMFPRFRGKINSWDEAPIGGILILGFLLSISHIVVGPLLPAPSRWAPAVLNDYFEARRGESLQRLTEMATERDSRQHDHP
jgi:hypothetical protein